MQTFLVVETPSLVDEQAGSGAGLGRVGPHEQECVLGAAVNVEVGHALVMRSSDQAQAGLLHPRRPVKKARWSSRAGNAAYGPGFVFYGNSGEIAAACRGGTSIYCNRVTSTALGPFLPVLRLNCTRSPS